MTFETFHQSDEETWPVNFFSTFSKLFLNFFSIFPQLFLNLFSTFSQLFFNFFSTFSQLFLTFSHLFFLQFSFNFFSTFFNLWHLRHWLQYWQLRTWIHDNLCFLTAFAILAMFIPFEAFILQNTKMVKKKRQEQESIRREKIKLEHFF